MFELTSNTYSLIDNAYFVIVSASFGMFT